MTYFFIILFLFFFLNIFKNYFIVQFILLFLILLFFIKLLFILIIYIIFNNFYINKKYKELYKIWLRNIFYLNFNKKYNLNLKKNIFNLRFNKIDIPIVKVKKIILFTSSKKLILSLIKDINSSVKSVYIIFYIWESFYLSDKVIFSLINASNRGVKCKIILDSIGSLKFFKTIWPKIMIDSGIEIIESFKFNFFNFIFNRIDFRQHKKIVLIDFDITYIGSMNLVDSNNFKKYLNLNQLIDLMVKIKGSFLVKVMKIIFSYDWELETGINILNKSYFIDLKKIFFKKKKFFSKVVQVINSSPGLPKNLIHDSVLDIISSAKKRLIITTPYFVPSIDLFNIICILARRGVDVSVIIPEKNDSFIVNWVNKYYFSYLLLSNIKIYLFRSGFLHTKTILIDDNISLVGTVNFDIRSLLLNFEVALIINDNVFNNKLFNINKKYISKSKLINYFYWNKRSFFKKILENFFYVFNSLL